MAVHKGNQDGKHRLQLHFSDSDFERVERLCKLSESSTMSSTIRESLRVYLWLLEKTLEGGKGFVEMPDGTRLSLLTTTIITLQTAVERGKIDHLKDH